MKRIKFYLRKPYWDYWYDGGWDFYITPTLLFHKDLGVFRNRGEKRYCRYSLTLCWLFIDIDFVIEKYEKDSI